MREPSVSRVLDIGRSRMLLLALAPVLLHALAREADRGLGLVLRAEVEPDGLLVEVGRAMGAEAAGAAVRVALWLVAGVAAWLALAGWRRRRDGTAWAQALASETTVFALLLLRPAVTLVALLSVATRASYPYGFTLPVALTQDWAIAQDAAVLAALVAWRLPALRFPAPRAGEVFALAFLTYALLVPEWAWRWEGHPGNEPKYLRQAVALGHGLTFDAEGVSAAMEDLPTRPLSESVASAVVTLGRQSWSMAVALSRGEVGREAIRAERITRQTIRGKDGGVFYVLAPGPSLMLAPALRVDRAINLARGRPGRVAASVLEWCALAALLVMALFLLVRDATGRPGLAAALAFGFALVPPFLFYSFQFYPEMVGALVMALAFRTLALRPESLRRRPWLFGLMLATLPWLHQKFLPVWLVLVATAFFVGWRDVRLARTEGPRHDRLAVGGRPPRADARRPVPDRALQLRHHRERAAGRALPGVGAGRRDERAGGPGGPRPVARRAVRDPALRADPVARGRGPRPGRRAAFRRGDAGGRRVLPDRGLGRQLGGRGVQPRPVLHAGGPAGGRTRRHRDRPGVVIPTADRR